jgi:hypothetical protein
MVKEKYCLLEQARIVHSVQWWAVCWMAGVWFPEGAIHFFLLHSIQTGSGAHLASYPMGTMVSFPGGGKAARLFSWPLTCIWDHSPIHPHGVVLSRRTTLPVPFTVFWNVLLCSLVEVYRCFGGMYYLHLQGRRVKDGSSAFLWNICKLLPDCMTLIFVQYL